MKDISKHIYTEDHTKLVYKVDDTKSYEVWIKGLLEIYEKSLILKNVGSLLGIDATLSAINKKLENSEKERMIILLKHLEDRIEMLDKEKLDYNFINSEEFAELLFKVCNSVRREYRKEKIKYYTNILINYSTIEFSKDFYKEYIIDRLANYTVEHILLLQKIREKHLELNDNNKLDYLGEDSPLEYLSKEVTDICINTLISDEFLIRGFWGDGYLISQNGIKCVELIKDLY